MDFFRSFKLVFTGLFLIAFYSCALIEPGNGPDQVRLRLSFGDLSSRSIRPGIESYESLSTRINQAQNFRLEVKSTTDTAVDLTFSFVALEGAEFDIPRAGLYDIIVYALETNGVPFAQARVPNQELRAGENTIQLHFGFARTSTGFGTLKSAIELDYWVNGTILNGYPFKTHMLEIVLQKNGVQEVLATDINSIAQDAQIQLNSSWGSGTLTVVDFSEEYGGYAILDVSLSLQSGDYILETRLFTNNLEPPTAPEWVQDYSQTTIELAKVYDNLESTGLRRLRVSSNPPEAATASINGGEVLSGDFYNMGFSANIGLNLVNGDASPYQFDGISWNAPLDPPVVYGTSFSFTMPDHDIDLIAHYIHPIQDALPLVLGTSVEGEQTRRGETDWYKLVVTAPGMVRAFISANTGDQEQYLSILDQNLNELVFATSYNGEPVALSAFLPIGEYRVKFQSRYTGIRTYTLATSFEPATGDMTVPLYNPSYESTVVSDGTYSQGWNFSHPLEVSDPLLGSGWGLADSGGSDGDKYLITSYQTISKYQIVTLASVGLTPEILTNNEVIFTFSEMVSQGGSMADTHDMSLELLNGSDIPIYTVYSNGGSPTTIDHSSWLPYSLSISTAGITDPIYKLRITTTAKDGEALSGHYGTRIDAASLKITIN